MSDALVVLNAGSSSIKFTLYVRGVAGGLDSVAAGEIESLGSSPHFRAHGQGGTLLAERVWREPVGHDALLGELIGWIESHLGPRRLVAAGHRVAHGGPHFAAPVCVTPGLMERLRALVPLAPLHQPHNLAPIEALAHQHPGLIQVACFDTAFHASNTPLSRLYGLPRALADEGVRRYGFHGLSCEYIAGELPRHEPRAASGRVVVAHLGSGASMCALLAGRSIASTMGFSALDGLPMGTRCGALDPGVILYLLQEKGMDAQQIETLLYRQSGLLGVSGVSDDMRVLLESEDVHAREAVDLFIDRIVRELGSLAAAACGLDALVFTAGIGEHAAAVRARVCAQAAWLGIELDPRANVAGGPCISTSGSRVSAWVIPTDEDLMIARHTADLVYADQPTTTAE